MTAHPAIGRFIEAASHRTNLHELGQGPALALLHGSGPGVSGWSNWHSVMPELARHSRVIVPDIAGFGYTHTQPDGVYNIKTWVAHYVGILDTLGIERASIVGNSFGGALALATALSNPHRVDKLVLLGTPVGEFEMTPGLKAGWHYEPGLEAMEAVLKLFPYDPSCITAEMVGLRYETSARPGAQEAFRKLVPKPNETGPTPVKGIPESALAKVRHPTLILHGREDAVVPLELGLRLLRGIPDARMHTFGQCGHWVQVERRSEFIDLVGRFLQA
ncbi:MAG: alpha/beta fold hydrolase [Proteobacteria bacterium]|nr:alpha/beta fold hydrolase [Pseudomonadota bacterium]